MKKRMIVLVLCLVMLLSLAACGGETAKQTQPAATETQAPVTQAPETTESVQTTATDYTVRLSQFAQTDAEPMAGHWSDGNVLLSIAVDGTAAWIDGSKNCGTWSLEGNTLTLTPAQFLAVPMEDGKEVQWEVNQLSSDLLAVKIVNAEHTLNRVSEEEGAAGTILAGQQAFSYYAHITGNWKIQTESDAMPKLLGSSNVNGFVAIEKDATADTLHLTDNGVTTEHTYRTENGFMLYVDDTLYLPDGFDSTLGGVGRLSSRFSGSTECVWTVSGTQNPLDAMRIPYKVTFRADGTCTAEGKQGAAFDGTYTVDGGNVTLVLSKGNETVTLTYGYFAGGAGLTLTENGAMFTYNGKSN